MERKRKGRDRDGNWGGRGEVWVSRKNRELGGKVEKKTSGERQGEGGRSEKKGNEKLEG